MKRLTTALTIAALSWPISLAQAQPPEPTPPQAPAKPAFDFEKWRREQGKVARQAPDTMLRHFAQSISEGDLEAAAEDVVGAEKTPALQRLQKMVQQQQRDWQLTASPLFQQPEGEAFTARVATLLRLEDVLMSDEAQRLLMRFEQVDVRREGEEWKIVPRPQRIKTETIDLSDPEQQITTVEKAVSDGRDEKDGFLNQWARIVTQPRGLTVRITSRNSMNNVKQLLLGILQLTQDNDERFAFDADNFADRLMPYVKNEGILQMPTLDNEKAAGYTLNPGLFGKSLADINEAARTVAVYEAGNGIGGLNYRFNGRAVVGYADGHVKLLSPEETTDLVWNIGAKPSG